jgi:hypothetical protein
VKLQVAQQYGACQDIPYKVKDKLLHLALPLVKKKKNAMPSSPLWILEETLTAHLPSDPKSCWF